MQQDKLQTSNRQPSDSNLPNRTGLQPENTGQPLHHPSHPTLKHKKILQESEICCRFDQVSGHQPPKRMTTGKFVYLGPCDNTLETPL